MNLIAVGNFSSKVSLSPLLRPNCPSTLQVTPTWFHVCMSYAFPQACLPRVGVKGTGSSSASPRSTPVLLSSQHTCQSAVLGEPPGNKSDINDRILLATGSSESPPKFMTKLYHLGTSEMGSSKLNSCFILMMYDNAR